MSLIPPVFLNTVVALGLPSEDGTVKYNATGFLYGHPTGQINEGGSRTYYVFLVTNRHVFQQASQRSDTLHARFNKLMETGSNMYEIGLKDASWSVHPDPAADVAVLSINPNRLLTDGIEYYVFQADDQAFTLEQARTSQISEGDGIFVLGFPLGLAGEERNYVIVRQGIIARAQDWLKGNSNTLLIDASVFPGNSGGPVLTRPEAVSIQGTKSNNLCSVIGMVSSYLPYREEAVSVQTGRRRMIFEENSGLCVVVPHNVIQQVVEVAVDKLESGQQVSSDLGVGRV